MPQFKDSVKVTVTGTMGNVQEILDNDKSATKKDYPELVEYVMENLDISDVFDTIDTITIDGVTYKVERQPRFVIEEL